ncbi:8-oxo-dGTP diphosphatase [Sediminihabitans luteus]|uniref:8-oxo-dGTP diphosphatase n=1 Tax=Sediminihabitans luteus TaxID=1138585 RepID=A0A2M9D0F2_9CELL|nr:NUDIX hydrolase [Sediminihabitans luteus]PJJ77565.1 8-oxo-dGTP diphosphatase [Sediminihabitans luteus]GII98464.1 ADP-ribose pyrophosphatase [Sediminihabitans luteus]
MVAAAVTASPLRAALGPTRVEHARVIETAGALVWRVREGELQVRLVHRPRYDDWSWPKGKLDPGEAFPTAAVREVAEETGRSIVLGQPLPGLQYLTPEGRVKRVHYWAAQRATKRDDAAAITARAPVHPVSPEEIDASVWLSAEDAARRLTRKVDRVPLAALVAEHEHGRLSTHPVVIARHGKAQARSTWYGDERDRPLTPMGHAQAAAMVPVLAAYGVGRVVTSRWERCATTIAPFAHAAGIMTTRSEQLTEAQHERSPGRVGAVVRAMLEDPQPSVLCTHRPVLPTVLDVLGQHARRSVANALPTTDPFLEPGELIVAHVAQTDKGPRVVAAERVSPPLH